MNRLASVNDDYYVARLPNGGVLYYGYEETDEEGNWCFVASLDGKEYRFPYPQLEEEGGARDMFDVWECFGIGVALLFDHGIATLSSSLGGDES